jgi:phosphate transport system protein
MRSRLDAQLEQLHTALIEMGALIEYAISSAADALFGQDVAQAARSIAFDREVDQKEKDIESLCLRLLLQQQPVARDLRLISAALKMITDMERIGDQSADIAEIVSHLAGAPYITDLSALRRMAGAACGMVKRSVDAFVQRDLALAQAVVADDDIVDAQFCAVRRTLVELIRRDASCGEQALDLLMVAKYLERIGDHAVNIAEWVIYSITGVHKNEELVDHI